VRYKEQQLKQSNKDIKQLAIKAYTYGYVLPQFGAVKTTIVQVVSL